MLENRVYIGPRIGDEGEVEEETNRSSFNELSS
jgi:hypothetical protein